MKSHLFSIGILVYEEGAGTVAIEFLDKYHFLEHLRGELEIQDVVIRILGEWKIRNSGS